VLRTRLVLVSGGEPLVRADLFEALARFRRAGARIWLLTSGVLLERHAAAVAANVDRLTVSLDAPDRDLYRVIRGVDGLPALEAGLARVRALAPRLRVTARSTLHRLNFMELPRLVDKAKALGLDGISFLAADVDSTAFGRAAGFQGPRRLLLDAAEVEAFRGVIERTVVERRADFASGFVEEHPAKLGRLATHYDAVLGRADFPPVRCDAPWVSVVVEPDGAVRPCYFHPPVGNLRQRPLLDLLETALPAFRAGLDVASNPVCRRCVCSLATGPRRRVW
jgi:MoaA/NifB/PqqE/SkfB family radical SAM enzyme